MRKGKYLLGIVFIIAVFLHPHIIFAWWHIAMVDKNYGGIITSPKSLAVGNNGSIHIVYKDIHIAYNGNSLEAEAKLVHAYHDKWIWYKEVVVTGSEIEYPSIALDTSNNPHISYGDNRQLRYAYKDSSGWHTEIVDNDIGMYIYFEESSLALDTSNNPHIGYYFFNALDWEDSLKHAYKDSSGWHIEVVDSGNQWSKKSMALALDTNDNPHIIYKTSNYAYRDSSGWHTEFLYDVGSGTIKSIALDTSDNPHIVVIKSGDRYLKYAYKDSSGWHSESVDDSALRPELENIVFTGHSIALDSNDNPHISYGYSTSDYSTTSYSALQYAYKDALSWHIETLKRNFHYSYPPFPYNFINIGSGFGFLMASSIALDLHNNPHVIFSNFFHITAIFPLYLENNLYHSHRFGLGY